MAHRRKSRLSGSPAEHAVEARKNAEIAVERYARSHKAASAGRCDQAFVSLVEAEFANGASYADDRWAGRKTNHAMIERAAEGAMAAFDHACGFGHKRGLSGLAAARRSSAKKPAAKKPVILAIRMEGDTKQRMFFEFPTRAAAMATVRDARKGGASFDYAIAPAPKKGK